MTTTTEAWAVKGPDGILPGTVTPTELDARHNARAFNIRLLKRVKFPFPEPYKHVRVRITEVPND